ncbi:unnamed protein product [Parnassius apollo]|uniref:(apollo) hypothetical protein n=1 Tax=Parnassius apollo TaxID=110799 RepID=A0A8S3X2C2_PARAO|nr:unnamed protein product [Parnassius apollo]
MTVTYHRFPNPGTTNFTRAHSTVVEELLNEKENIFHQNIEQSSEATAQPKLRVPLSEIENIVVEPCTSAKSSTQTLVDVARTTGFIDSVQNELNVATCSKSNLTKKRTKILANLGVTKHDIEVTSDFQCNEKPVKGTVKWSHIEAFYQLDKTNPNLVYAPQLTDNHLRPNCQQKMRVKLAAQVFSHSVTTGMLMKIAQNELPAEAHKSEK